MKIVDVVVQFLFSFVLFMLIYDNEYETKENKNWTKDKIELPNRYSCVLTSVSKLQIG